MCSPNVSTDSSPWGGWALSATFYPALINSFSTPPTEYEGVACPLVGCPQWLELHLLGQAPWQGLQDPKLRVLWTPEGAEGKRMDQDWGGIGREEVWTECGGRMKWLPSGVHTGPPLQIPWQPPWTFPTPLPPSSPPRPLVFLPSLFFCWPLGAISIPAKKEERACNYQRYKRWWGGIDNK